MIISSFNRVYAARKQTDPVILRESQDSLRNAMVQQFAEWDFKDILDPKTSCLGLPDKFVRLNGHIHNIPFPRVFDWLSKPKYMTEKEIKKLKWFSEVEEKDPIKFEKLGSKQINYYKTLRRKKESVKERKELFLMLRTELEQQAEKNPNISLLQKKDRRVIYFNTEGFTSFCSQEIWDDCGNQVRNAFMRR